MMVRGFCKLVLGFGLLQVWKGGISVTLEWVWLVCGVLLVLCLLLLPLFFLKFVQLGRVLRCHLPVAGGRVVHLVVVYGFQGASTDPEKLRLTEKLLDAVLCELAVLVSLVSLSETRMLNLRRFHACSRVSWLV